MTIKKATFWSTDDKSAVDKLNLYIAKEEISKCDILNIETSVDCEGNHFLNLFYWES